MANLDEEEKLLTVGGGVGGGWWPEEVVAMEDGLPEKTGSAVRSSNAHDKKKIEQYVACSVDDCGSLL